MEIRLNYSATSKENGRFLFEDEVSVRVSKREALEICKYHFVSPFRPQPNEFNTVCERGCRKVRSEIYKKRALKRNEYELEIEFAYDQSELITDAFIKEFLKFLLKDAYEMGCTIYNDHGLHRVYGDVLRLFSEYYSGNLAVDAEKIQQRIMRQ